MKIWLLDIVVIMDFFFLMECDDIFNEIFEIFILEVVKSYFYFFRIVFSIFEFDVNLKI